MTPTGSRTSCAGSTPWAGSAAPTRSRPWSPTCCPSEASFVNGATVPVDGGRSVLGPDPESRDS